jgi:hypothetical protein
VQPGSKGSAFVGILIGVVALGLVAILGIRALGGKSVAAPTKPAPRPTQVQQHEVGVLSAFVYERGSYWGRGNVKACQPDWHLAHNVRAQISCVAFGQAAVYTRFDNVSEATASFKQLSVQGSPGTGNWGRCDKLLPAGAWSRKLLEHKQHGEVAFRQLNGQAIVVWTWPDMQTVAEARGSLINRQAVCDAWDLNA